MKKTFCILFIVLAFLKVEAQNKNNNNEYCVINIYGTNLFKEAGFDSKVLTKIKAGEYIIAQKFITTDQKKVIGKDFGLNGDWIKVEYNSLIGFVFSSDLTQKQVELTENEYGQINLSLLGNLLEETSETKKVTLENGEFENFVQTKKYENGIYTYSSFDGCFNHITEYRELTINEVYYQVVSDYGNEIETYNLPRFLEKEGNIIRLEGEGATTDLQIEVKNDGTFKVSSYDCT